jgi:hypothetical protein
MNIERRTFLQQAPLAAIWTRIAWALGSIGIALLSVGCGVFNAILAWVPVGEAAVNSILSILTANGIVIIPGLQVYVSLIEAGFAALTGAIKEYQSTTPPPVGALAKIETAFKDVTDNFKTFLASLNVSGGLLSIIVGIAQVIFSTIAAFLNQLPPAVKGQRRTIVGGDTIRVSNQSFIVIPKNRNNTQFRHDVDAVLATAGQGVVIPASARL